MSKVQVKAQLRRGDIINSECDIQEIVLTTQWGILTIPIADVSSIDFGIHSDDSLIPKVETLVFELAENHDQKRIEFAEKELLKGPVEVVTVLSNLLNEDKFENLIFEEVTPDEVLNQLLTQYHLDYSFLTEDVVTIKDDYKIAGSVNLSEMKLNSTFGDLTIPVENINKVEFTVESSEMISKRFYLQAEKHIQANSDLGWVKTGIKLKKGQSFVMSSKGEIILASYSNYKYTPDGMAYPPGGTPYPPASKDINMPQIGCPVFKIGENGTVLNAYDKISYKANTTGMLYVTIHESVYNSGNKGKYDVFVKLK